MRAHQHRRTAGTITLAADLIDHAEAFQDFLVAHELLHLRVPNHSRALGAQIQIS
jgi:predicted metal-dependent hydrolase